MEDSNNIVQGREEKAYNEAHPRSLSGTVHNLALIVIFLCFVVGCLLVGFFLSILIIPDIHGCVRMLTGISFWFCWPLATLGCASVSLILALRRAKPRRIWTSIVVGLLVILTVYLVHFLLNTLECPGLWRGDWSSLPTWLLG